MKYTSLMFCLLTSSVTPHVIADSSPDEGTSFHDSSHLLNFERTLAPHSDGLYGMAWIDFDNDQDLDLFIPAQKGGQNALYRNDMGSFTDVAASAGIAGGEGQESVVTADINNDGCTDLLAIGDGGFSSNTNTSTTHQLYKNNCDGTFSNITASSGISAPKLGLMAAFGDIDNDGDVDLFITSPGSLLTGLTPQVLYLNNGDETFTDISASAGIDSSLGGCVVSFADMDQDGYQDILLGNCNNLFFPDGIGVSPGLAIPGPWQYFHNNGDNTFTDIANETGLNVRPGFPMAITIADIENDGDLDFFATGLGSFFGLPEISPLGVIPEQVLFVNNGDGTFSDGTYDHGLGGYFWGWGAVFADFDADGDEDLFQVGSMPPILGVVGDQLASPGRLFENDGYGNMSNVENFGLQGDFVSGLAAADYDGNGFIDLVIAKTSHDSINLFGQSFSGNGQPVLLSNQGNGNQSITIALQGTTSNRNGIGARVLAKTANTLQTKVVFAGTSFSSDNSPWLTFGLGKHKAATFTISWPSGLVEKFTRAAKNQLVVLQEGSGTAVNKSQ